MKHEKYREIVIFVSFSHYAQITNVPESRIQHEYINYYESNTQKKKEKNNTSKKIIIYCVKNDCQGIPHTLV